MNSIKNQFISLILLVFTFGCGIYSFTGASIPAGAKSFQVNYFENQAGSRPGSTVEPGVDRDFTLELQDLILNQTNLNLVSSNGDLVYEGEIVEYSVTPMTSTANLTAAQNRLTVTVNLRYTNINNEEDDFESRFSFFYDFPAEQQLYDIKGAAHDEIFERLTQNIFNATLAKW
ncbi:MAG: LptE family protein [Flavobacteriales bacterium]|tara:strand:+ start:41 stop:562 length:522 start_codon:yes stop_codon:yes gene_type:complete